MRPDDPWHAVACEPGVMAVVAPCSGCRNYKFFSPWLENSDFSICSWCVLESRWVSPAACVLMMKTAGRMLVTTVGQDDDLEEDERMKMGQAEAASWLGEAAGQ